MSDNIRILTDNGAETAIFCGKSEEAKDVLNPKNIANQILSAGLNWVDSFDFHRAETLEHQQKLDSLCQSSNLIAVMAMGWDPGIDSMIRAIMKFSLPGEHKTLVTFGPGMSMGHTTSLLSLVGVANAIQITEPGEARGTQNRRCFIALKSGVSADKIEELIRTSPRFADAVELFIYFVSPEEVAERRRNMFHGGEIYRGETNEEDSVNFMRYEMRTESNPGFTAQLLLAGAQAVQRIKERLGPGAYTPIDVPLWYFLPLSREEAIVQLV